MSELERLLGMLRKVIERPEVREEFRVELYLLGERDPALYEETMVELENLEPQLHRETRDFIENVREVREFLAKTQEYRSASS